MITDEVIHTAQNQYNLLFRAISDGAIVADRAGLLVRINPAAAGMLRCIPDDMLGRLCADVFKDQPILIDLLGGHGDSTRELQLPGKRTVIGIRECQTDGSYLVLLQDITERAEL